LLLLLLLLQISVKDSASINIRYSKIYCINIPSTIILLLLLYFCTGKLLSIANTLIDIRFCSIC
jgi:hypothetical protein